MKIIRATSRTEGYMCDFCGSECCDYETAGEQHRCIACVADQRNELRAKVTDLQVEAEHLRRVIARLRGPIPRGTRHV